MREVDVSLPFLLLLVGFLYALLVSGLALFRREGFSTRFAVEAALITIIASGLTALAGLPINPAVFLIVLYLLTMRVRILVDLANIFAKQGRYNLAERLYEFASRLWPDVPGRLALNINQATMQLQERRLDESIATFTEVLKQADQGQLGAKYEAAAHYNLGVAYLRKDMDARAAIEFNAVIDTWPMSLYARRAEEALEKRRRRNVPITTKENT